MPANRVVETAYIGVDGSFDAYNRAANTTTSQFNKAGELGIRVVTADGRQYQFVQLDSGATSATSIGVVAANQLAYWKSKSSYIVTNDVAQAVGGQGGTSQFRNEVAGVFRAAITAGNFCYVLQKAPGVNVASKASTYVVGDWVVSDTSTSTAQCDVVTAGTAPGVMPIGKAAATRSGANVSVDLEITGIE